MSACPSCGDDANVRKVSGLFREQRSGARGTELSVLLASPQVDPILPSGVALEFEEHFFIAAFGVVFAVVGGLVGWFGVSSSKMSAVIFAWMGVILGFVAGSVVGFAYGASRSAMIVSVAEGVADAKRQSPDHMRRLERWEQAYYCLKHDVVILPCEGETFSPTEFSHLMTGDA
jgi:hypothetical protein